jgi:hypothetical protein
MKILKTIQDLKDPESKDEEEYVAEVIIGDNKSKF